VAQSGVRSADRYGWTEQSQNFLSIAEAEKASNFFKKVLDNLRKMHYNLIRKKKGIPK